MGSKPDRVSDSCESLTADEMGVAAGQVPLGLVLEPPPQEIRDDQAQNPVAEKFEPLVVAMGGLPAAPAATVLGRKRTRMGQGFRDEFGPGERVPDCLSQIIRSQSRPDARSVYAVEQPAVADRERPFPDLPQSC